VGSCTAKPKEREVGGGVLRASLTMKGVTVAEAVKASVRWQFFQVPRLDTRQL
jgi:hypothetical protein